MKNLIFLFLLLPAVALAHNPLQGTKWVILDQNEQPTFTIDFSGHNNGSIMALKDQCSFTYNANHTHLFIQVGECTTAGGGSGIIPCCEQQTLPFVLVAATEDAPASLKFTIGETEYVLQRVE